MGGQRGFTLLEILVALAIPGTAIGGANPTNLITNGNFVTPCGAAPIALHNSISLVDITRP